MFVEFLQEWGMAAMNTWDGDRSLLVKEDNVLLDQVFTHRLYSTGRLRQIDYLCCSTNVKVCCKVVDGFRDEASTDHWPLLGVWSTGSASPCHQRRKHKSVKGWLPSDVSERTAFNECFRASLGQGKPEEMQVAIQKAISITKASTYSSRKADVLEIPVELVELRSKFHSLPDNLERKQLVRRWSHLNRKWVAQKHAAALDRLALTGKRDAGKSRRIPDSINFSSGPKAMRAEWPNAFARKYEFKCNRSGESQEVLFRKYQLLMKESLQGNRLELGMTLMLQALAGMACNKCVGKDGIPVEALKALDWHSKLLVLQCFGNRLNGKDGFCNPVQDWLTLIAQFIPKSSVPFVDSDSWRAVLIGASLQKWFLSTLLLYSTCFLDNIPSYIMGFRSGFQTAMLIKPLRVALLLAHEWQLLVAVAITDADSAFESLSHSVLIDSWHELGAPSLLVAVFLP